MKLKYYGYEDEIGEDFTYFGDVIKTKSVYIIPFINLYITEEHPLNISKKKAENIDKAYLVFLNYKSIKVSVYHSQNDGGKFYEEKGDVNLKNLKTIYIGGNSLANRFNKRNNFFENINWEIQCETFFLQLLENSKISDNIYSPFNSNKMLRAEVFNFSKNNYLPNSLQKLVGLQNK